MELVALSLVVLSTSACFAAMGGWVAHWKNRRPVEGLMLGAVLGPVGLVLEIWKPYTHRPMVDRGAQNSFRSLVRYQSEQILLPFPEPSPKPTRRPRRLAPRWVS